MPAASQIPDSADDSDLAESLMSLSEIEEAPGAPPGLMEQPLQDPDLYENPDPRGPCGAPVDQPEFKDAAIAAYGASRPPQATIVNAVWDLPEGEAEAFLEATREDIRPNCRPFISKTPFGEQRVEFLRQIRLPDVADEALATTSRIIVEGQPALYAGGVLMRQDTRLSMIIVFSEDPVAAPFIQSVARTGAESL